MGSPPVNQIGCDHYGRQLMASTTITTASAPTSALRRRTSLSGSSASSLVPAPLIAAQSSLGSLNPSPSVSFNSMQPPQVAGASQQSQSSSQQSFSMSQPSSQTANLSASVYRQYTDPPPKPPNEKQGPIYSVGIFRRTHLSVTMLT